jgi:L-asparaginases, type II
MRTKAFFPLVFCFAFLLVGPLSANASPEALPKVVILGTGGTIAATGGSATDLTNYKAGDLTADEIIAAVPSLKDFAQISAEQVDNIGSSNVNRVFWLKLAKRVNEVAARKDVDGIVITHGTNTLEETGYVLNLTAKTKKPIVLVGSMRPATAISADGPLNLLQAVAVAGSKEAAGKGVMFILNGEINGAREGTKTNTTAVETFRSHDIGFLGYVAQNKPVFYRESLRRHTTDSEFDMGNVKELPKVEVLYVYADPGTEALDGMISAKAEGVVMAGLGNGALPKVYQTKLGEVAKNGVAVVRSSRVGTGIVTHESSDDKVGFITSDNLTPQKARILLMVALTKTKDPKEIQRIFNTY